MSKQLGRSRTRAEVLETLIFGAAILAHVISVMLLCWGTVRFILGIAEDIPNVEILPRGIVGGSDE
jgi:hypothetical protein